MAASAVLFAAGLSLSHMCHGVTAAPASGPALYTTTPSATAPVVPALDQLPIADYALAPSESDTQPPSLATATKKRKLYGRFLHITDFHPDEFYQVHSSTSAESACHSGKGPAGTYGAETSDCDAPISLVNATFDWIAQNLRDNIDFVVWTGDSARHDSDESIPRSPAQVLGTNRLLADKFADTFSVPSGMSIPVVPNFGNNDILPHNILLPGPNKWLSYYSDIWRKFIPEEQRHSFEFGGWFYVEVIPNKLAIFSLNTLYLFDRNAGVDDCVKPSEPGFKQFEWLRVQLQFMRERGMKAILMGHVPPARTDSKMLWDETCWQKYTLWLQQYRDVVVSGLFGHMNIDHFLLLDTKEINISPAGADSFDHTHEDLDQELSVQSATDYLAELRDGWSKLPKPLLFTDLEVESEKSGSGKKKKGNKDKKKGKKDKKDKNKKKLGGEWAERYQLALVSPSIVPNYFPTLRVFEYNITGLEDSVLWADYDKQLPTAEEPVSDLTSPSEGIEPELELRSLPDDDDDEDGIVEAEKNSKANKHKKKNGHKKDKKKKKKKGKKGKGGDNSKDPNLVVPSPPNKSSPPGPAYSPQPLTLMSYTQYFANLTYINNDIKSQSTEDDDFETEKWREGKHGDKKPKHSEPNPRTFKFEVEYDTRTDKAYKLADLTVRSFVDLAYRMGQTARSKKSAKLSSLDDGDDDDDDHDYDLEEVDDDDIEVETVKDLDDDFDLGEEGELESDSDDEEVSVEKKKRKKGHKKKKKKKKKKKAKKLNKIWLEFLKRAFVGTMEEEEIKDKFS